jgi:hypothetical protein
MGPVFTDKDGGFALIEKEVLWCFKLTAANGDEYEKVSWHESFEMEADSQYCDAAKADADKTDDKALLFALGRDHIHLNSGLIAMLGCTLKTTSHRAESKYVSCIVQVSSS